MNVRNAILWLVTLVVLGFVGYGIYGKETLIRYGEPVLLKLAPVDPRSLIQGDYMDLRYAIAADLEQEELPWRGKLVIRLDDQHVAHFVRVDDGTPLAPGERLLNYYRHEWTLDLGASSYFFQEGTADRYAAAEYGELRVDAGGNSILIGLRDEELQPLGPGPDREQ
ncbi:MAG TPA: GDYXXLXY domain-containing protein [Caldilineaceae bacterium]|nr:GDYXXLXY domain-containing protein [Caldilineaceae bacterium]